MDSHKRKVIKDHARKAGHLVDLWDSSDISWYFRNRMNKK